MIEDKIDILRKRLFKIKNEVKNEIDLIFSMKVLTDSGDFRPFITPHDDKIRSQAKKLDYSLEKYLEYLRTTKYVEDFKQFGFYEQFVFPSYFIKIKSDDCDGFCTWLSSILIASGYAAHVVIGYVREHPDEKFGLHCWVEYFNRNTNSWSYIETTNHYNFEFTWVNFRVLFIFNHKRIEDNHNPDKIFFPTDNPSNILMDLKNRLYMRNHEVFSVNISNKSRWSFLKWNPPGTKKSQENAELRAVEYLKKFLQNHYPNEFILNQIPPTSTLRKNSVFERFFQSIYNYKLSWNEIVRRAGFKVHKEQNLWSFLDRDKHGKRLNYNESIIVAANYFKFKVLLIDYKEIFLKNEAPTSTDLLNHRIHSKFISAIDNRGLRYTDILKALNLKLNLIPNKWSFLDYDRDGNPLTAELSLQAAVQYFMQKILTREVREGLGLGKNDAPREKDLIVLRFQDFLGAISNRGMNYNMILRKVGLRPNRDPSKWSKLNWGRNGKPRSYKQAIKESSKFLKSLIDKNFRKKYGLGIDEAPTAHLSDKQFKNFISALTARRLLYNDVLEEAGYIPHDIHIFTMIGRNFHWIAERIFLEYTRGWGCFSFYEIYPNIKSTNFKLKHCDNTIFVDNNFRSLSKFTKNIPEHIKFVNIDYYLGNSLVRAKEKCLKGYQDKFTMLILVPINAKKSYPPPNDIPHRNNVKIMDPLSFAKFIGLKGKLFNSLMQNVELAKKATYIENLREPLELEANKNRNTIKRKYNYNQQEFENFLKQRNLLYLLKYNPDSSSLMKWTHFLDKNEDFFNFGI